MVIKANKREMIGDELVVSGYSIKNVKKIIFNDLAAHITFEDGTEKKYPKEEITSVWCEKPHLLVKK